MNHIHSGPDTEILDVLEKLFNEHLVDKDTRDTIYHLVCAVDFLGEQIACATRQLRDSVDPCNQKVAELLAAYVSAAGSCGSSALGSLVQREIG